LGVVVDPWKGHLLSFIVSQDLRINIFLFNLHKIYAFNLGIELLIAMA
jgi:hypothetical protein